MKAKDEQSEVFSEVDCWPVGLFVRTLESIHFDSGSFSVEIQKSPIQSIFRYSQLPLNCDRVCCEELLLHPDISCVFERDVNTLTWAHTHDKLDVLYHLHGNNARAAPYLWTPEPYHYSPPRTRHLLWRTSSFVFQVGHTVDFTYLTRSVHVSFRGSVLCWFWGLVLNESIIFSFMFYSTTGPLRALIPQPQTPIIKEQVAQLSPAQPGILTYFIRDTWTSSFTSYCSSDNSSYQNISHILWGSCTAVHPSNNHSLISNCLFLRIIPNGKQSPFHSEPGL